MTTPLTSELTTDLNRIAGMSAAPFSAVQLRLLIRNDESRIEHLTAWVNAALPGEHRPTDAEIEHAHEQLSHHRARLEGLRIMRECAAPLSPEVSPAGSPGFRAR